MRAMSEKKALALMKPSDRGWALLTIILFLFFSPLFGPDTLFRCRASMARVLWKSPGRHSCDGTR